MAGPAETSRQTGNAAWSPNGPMSSEAHHLGVEIKVVAQGLDRDKFARLVAIGNRMIALGLDINNLENTTLAVDASGARGASGGAV